jgi:catechol 2,3-dioxygenase-like lactoylglutathione lyase family enzyme
MRVSANHHPGIRVSDIERSAQFYIDGLGGHWQTSPMTYEGPDAELIMGGTPNTRFKVCHIGFDEGTIELFQFLPSGPVDNPIPAEGGIIHYAFHVDDVPAALERVERAGGMRYWPEVRDMDPGFQVIYVTDPDGHVLELIDISIEDLVRGLVELDPANAPPA